MRYFIDTNIFLRTLIKEDEQVFNECYRILNAIKENVIQGFTSHIVLAEIVWTLSSYYKFDKTDVVKAITGITNLHGLKLIDHFDTISALALFENTSVKFIDAMIASIKEIQDKKMAVISYDRDFDKLGVRRKEPQDISY